MCLEAHGGTPRDGKKVILWNQCILENRRIIFPSLGELFNYLKSTYPYLEMK